MGKSSNFKTEDQYIVTHEVDRTGVRLDAFLKDRYRKRSRESLKRNIDSGAIAISRNQSPHLTIGRLKPSTLLIAGDEVLVVSDRKPEPPVCFDYRVLYEDEALFVIEKPANLPVHPAGRYFFNTLLTHLKTHGHKNPLSLEREYFLPHRIDKETSGILVLTKDKEVCAHLVNQFAERLTRKRYLAAVRGVAPERFTVDAPLMRTQTAVIELKMEVARPDAEGVLPPEAQEAHTEFRRLEIYRNAHGQFSLVECFPKTGRQHQIRVHLDHAGHPIVGDKLYGIPEDQALRFYERQHLSPEAMAAMLLPRHALHAAGLEFEHPLTGRTMSFESPMPEDVMSFLRG